MPMVAAVEEPPEGRPYGKVVTKRTGTVPTGFVTIQYPVPPPAERALALASAALADLLVGVNASAYTPTTFLFSAFRCGSTR